MVTRRYGNKEIWLYIILSAAILVMRLWHIAELDGPFVFNDEAGYWSHAANMVGLSWTNVEELWYSYGYSILLVPLFWITHNMQLLYRMAIVVNALMGVAGFAIGNAIIHEIEEDIDDVICMLISFVAVSYSSYLFQSNIAWSETFIYTWFLLVIWHFARFCKKTTWLSVIVLTGEISFLYVIHNRCIVIFVAYIMTLFYMKFKKKIEWEKITIAVLMIIGICILNSFVKVRLSEIMWGGIENGFGGNDISSQTDKLKLLLGVSGLKRLIASLAGKVWYLFSATLMIAYFGMVNVLKQFLSAIYWRKDDNENESKSFFYLFLGLFICGTIAITSIAMSPEYADPSQNIRLDLYFYGRYSEAVSGILIILGLLYIFKLSKRWFWFIELVSGLVLYLILFRILYLYTANIDRFWVNIVCVPGIYFFKDFSLQEISNYVLLFYIIGCVIGFIFSKWKKVRMICVSIPMMISFVVVYKNTFNAHIMPGQRTYDCVLNTCEILNQNTKYTIYNLIRNNYKNGIRTRVVESDMKFDIPLNYPKDYFVIAEWSNEKVADLLEQEMYLVAVSGNNFCLFGRGNNLKSDLVSQGYKCNDLEQLSIESLDKINLNLQLSDSSTKEVKHGSDLIVDVILKADNDNTVILNDNGYLLSYHIYDVSGNELLWDGKRYAINAYKGEGVVRVSIDADELNSVDECIIVFDVVEEGVEWLSKVGAKTISLDVNIAKE